MAQTLEYRLEQNQAEQQQLSETSLMELEREYCRAIRWIAKKEPELANALVDSHNHKLIFTELCRVYGHQLWEPNENEVYIWSKYNLILYIEIQLYKIVGIDRDFGAGLFLSMMHTILITVVCTAVVAILLPPHLFLILLCIYLGSILARVVLKIVDIRYNLKWYAPIYRLYYSQMKQEKKIQALKEREKYLRTSLNLIEKREKRRLEEDSALFYRALEGRRKE
jgi:hypothetical protein